MIDAHLPYLPFELTYMLDGRPQITDAGLITIAIIAQRTKGIDAIAKKRTAAVLQEFLSVAKGNGYRRAEEAARLFARARLDDRTMQAIDEIRRYVNKAELVALLNRSGFTAGRDQVQEVPEND